MREGGRYGLVYVGASFIPELIETTRLIRCWFYRRIESIFGSCACVSMGIDWRRPMRERRWGRRGLAGGCQDSVGQSGGPCVGNNTVYRF